MKVTKMDIFETGRMQLLQSALTGHGGFAVLICVRDSLAKWLWLRPQLCTFTSWATWESLNGLEPSYAMDCGRPFC